MSAINWYFIILLIGAIVLSFFTIPGLEKVGIGIAIFYISYLLISLLIACITKLVHRKSIDQNDEFEIMYNELIQSHSFNMLFIQAKAKILRVIVMSSIFTILAPGFIMKLVEYRRVFLIMGIIQAIVGIVFLKKYAEFYNENIKIDLLKKIDERFQEGNNSIIHCLSLYEESDFIEDEFKVIGIKNNIDFLLTQNELLKIMYIDVSKKNIDSEKYLFKGVFGNLKSTNNIKNSIKILNREIDGLNKMSLNNKDFNEYFDVYAEDITEAKMVLNENIQTKLVELYENNDFDYEVIIKPNNIYFRIHTDKLPEARTVDVLLDKKKLLYYYNMINFIMKLMNEIKNVTEI